MSSRLQSRRSTGSSGGGSRKVKKSRRGSERSSSSSSGLTFRPKTTGTLLTYATVPVSILALWVAEWARRQANQDRRKSDEERSSLNKKYVGLEIVLVGLVVIAIYASTLASKEASTAAIVDADIQARGDVIRNEISSLGGVTSSDSE